MGMIWRAMPLLSTLAALVIIAHSAEEGYDDERERDYRYEIRPRVLDTGTPSYDQPWRAIEAEPIVHEATSEDHQPYEEPVKRRRVGRKRKRRPMPASDDIPEELDIHQEETKYNPQEDSHISQERDVYHDETKYRSQKSQDTTDKPRRRRKRPIQDRQSRRTEEFYDFESPSRRRNRRKRPVLESAPRLSEFDLHDEPTTGDNQYYSPVKADYPNDRQKQEDNVIVEGSNVPNNYFQLQSGTKKETTNAFPEKPYKRREEDVGSLSEFSMEEAEKPEDKNHKNMKEVNELREKLRAKPDYISKDDKNQTVRSGPIDPGALKELLKRSNGTSLSEILQEHNLSLADLLHGKENAVSVLTSVPSQPAVTNINKHTTNSNEQKQTTEDKDENTTTLTTKSIASSTKRHTESKLIEKRKDVPILTTPPDSEERLEAKENGPRMATIRRYPGNTNIRRKLRLRPANGTMKSPLSRDLIAQTAKKYHYYNSKNSTKAKEWKHVLPSMNKTLPIEEVSTTESTEVPIEIETTTSFHEDNTTIQDDDDDVDEDGDTDASVTTTENNVNTDTSNQEEPNELELDTESENTAHNTTAITTTTTEITTTEKPKVKYERPVADDKKIGLRRPAFNNRLKRKRMKQKNSATETLEDDQLKDFLGLGNQVSSSEFVSRTARPETPIPQNNDEDFTSLDDFLTIAPPKRAENVKTTRISSMAYITPRRPNFVQSTTEETAKIEIEEILNDTRTSARLSKILMERNMTLNELVEHRERGSSHVHLADIFHNASKEPNPPEPFLSKSSIEPISKETYPLRALLEANLHDPTVKATTIDQQQSQYVNIPIVMDFGNNVNENGENMGIMSIFNKFTQQDLGVENSDVKKDSEGTPYITTIISVNASVSNASDGVRESKDLKELDVTGWNKLFELMRKHHENITEEESNTLATDDTVPEATKLDPVDTHSDDLIVLEHLNKLNAFETSAGLKDAKLDINSYESDTTIQPGILDRLPTTTRSVTVATASIVGLAMVLFLLTYAAFKWKQQRNLLSKKQSFSEERIPTPVFESRKGHKNNCSTRSISPMLASNIYTMNTLDSRAGTESPEYMWDTLRKPFQ